MVETISTFNSVEINKERSLVICDIDDTIMYYPKNEILSHCKSIVQEVFPDLDETHELYQKELKELIDMYKIIKSPKHTDFDGFIKMVNRIKNLGGNLVFLTARNESSIKITTKQFGQIGLNYNDYRVYYTNNEITKGRYIKENIDLSMYNDVIFIDDYESYIQTVLDEFSFIRCYKFQVDQ